VPSLIELQFGEAVRLFLFLLSGLLVVLCRAAALALKNSKKSEGVVIDVVPAMFARLVTTPRRIDVELAVERSDHVGVGKAHQRIKLGGDEHARGICEVDGIVVV